MADKPDPPRRHRPRRPNPRSVNPPSPPPRPHVSILRPILSTLARVLMVAVGAIVLIRHGAADGIGGAILVGSCVALIAVPLYHWIPGDFDRAKDKAVSAYRQVTRGA